VRFCPRLVDAESEKGAVLEFQQRQQDVLGPDVVVAQPQRFPGMGSGTSGSCGGSWLARASRISSRGMSWASINLTAREFGSASSPSAMCTGLTCTLPASAARACATVRTLLARVVNRLRSWPGPGSRRSLGTKRFWAACLVTPMLLPISAQEIPERRA
jgi:hypothetical protein